MKRIFASVGLVAVGAASLHAQAIATPEQVKPWSLQASLRGFYDDNYLTQPGGTVLVGGVPVKLKRSSFGVDVSPSFTYNHSMEDGTFSASYLYDLHFFADRSTTDQSHQLNLALTHQFTERYKLSVNDSFVVAQEPTVIDSSVISTPLRVAGNNIHNTGSILFDAEMTKLLDLSLGYVNSIYGYQQVAGDTPPSQFPSRSASLDRIDQRASADLRWKALPQTTGVLGYSFEHVSYTSPELIDAPSAAFPAGLHSNSRNSDDHFLYIGVDQEFNAKLNASVRIGGEYVDYVNAKRLGITPTDSTSPYVDASLTYQFMPTSDLQVGVKHVHNSTDVVGTTSPVLDEESTAAYVSISHSVADFTLSLMAQGQFSSFDGGGTGFSNQSDDFYIVALNAGYHINPFLLAEAGYEYDRLTSDLPGRAYVRNQVYIGLRANY